jgi:hypothetical protein
MPDPAIFFILFKVAGLGVPKISIEFSGFTAHIPSLNSCPIFSTFHLQISNSIGIIIVCPTACVTGSWRGEYRSRNGQNLKPRKKPI